MSDALREAIARALHDHDWPIGSWDTEIAYHRVAYLRRADAVLAVVRGVDAVQWETFAFIAWSDDLSLWLFADEGDEGAFPVYRRVVHVVPSPRVPLTETSQGLIDALQYLFDEYGPAGVRETVEQMMVDRCPTCGSDDRDVFLDGCDVDDGQPSGMDLGGHLIYDQPDPWHRVPSTEPRSEA